jgi:hypothetical protein
MSALRANRELRAFSKSNDHRLVTFAFEPEGGGVVAIEGCVRKEDASEVAKIFKRIVELTLKVEE